VLPFGNVSVTLDVNGAELKQFLEHGVSAMPGANGRFAQVSGLCLTYDVSAAVGAAALSLAVGGCLEGVLAEDYDVGMSQNAYLPDTYEVPVGETVVWENNGSRGHTVTAYRSALPDGADFFASGGFETTAAAREAWQASGAGNLSPGETFEHTFETPGEHGYFCIPHEPKGMIGTIVVTE
jgi:plastocyanin